MAVTLAVQCACGRLATTRDVMSRSWRYFVFCPRCHIDGPQSFYPNGALEEFEKMMNERRKDEAVGKNEADDPDQQDG